MTRAAIIDFETRSPVNLKKTSVGPYAEHPATEATMIAWNWSDRPQDEVDGCLIKDNRPVSNAFAELAEHVARGGAVVAHNGSFELDIWAMLHRRLPSVWPALRFEQLHDTMILGMALALPASLEKMAKALRLPVEKDEVGHKLMLKLCKPRKPKKGEDKSRLYWHEDPAEIERELQYCKTDIVVERRLWDVLPRLSGIERAVYEMDARINDRGIFLDLPIVRKLSDAVAVEKDALNAELYERTQGEVETAASKTFRGWLKKQGVDLPDMRKDTVAKALEDLRKNAHAEHPARRPLEIRQITGKASTAKLSAMLNRAMGDARARDLLKMNGAGTKRWAGSGIQPQNMPRSPEEFGPEEAEDVANWLAIGGADVVAKMWGSVHAAVSYSLRAMICAAPGRILYAADYSNIEGRVVAWLADELWKLQAFREYDAGTGPDLYKLAFAKAFGIAIELISKAQRQIGKVQELALQYQGAHGAFISMMKNYGIDIDDIVKTVISAVSPELFDARREDYWQGAKEAAEEVLADRRKEAERDELLDEAATGFEPDYFDLMQEIAKKNRHGLTADQWAALRIVVDNWRAAHEGVSAYWKVLERAAIEAIEHPGVYVSAGKVSYFKSGDFLLCILPSGGTIAYPFARIWKETKTFKNADGTVRDYVSKKVVYEGVDSKTKKWGRQFAYGGLFLENIAQATARDLLAEAMLRLEAKGYAIVLHVHDESVAEVPEGFGSLQEFCGIMSELPSWAEGLPVAVSGWEGKRYRK